jgi:hypothetical protein
MTTEIPNDLVKEADYARERGESPHTARNRRLRGAGPPYYKLPGRKSPVYVSRREADAYYRSFRRVPPLTARLMEEPKPKFEPRTSKRSRGEA